MLKKDLLVNNFRQYREQDETLPSAIIVDIDGTIALMAGRHPFDATKWHEDTPNQPVIDLVDFLEIGVHAQYGTSLNVIYLTGRECGTEQVKIIQEWLFEHTRKSPGDYKLFHRKLKDYRGDAIVKKELYETHIEGNYYVRWVLDDRDTVIKFWRDDMKLPTFQVHWGAF